MKTEIQNQIPNIPELNQNLTLNAPLLIEMYFNELLDFNKTWNWTDTISYLEIMNLAKSASQLVNSTLYKMLFNKFYFLKKI